MNSRADDVGSEPTWHLHDGAGLFPHPGNRAQFTEIVKSLADDYFQWHESCAAASPSATGGTQPDPDIGAVRSLIGELSSRLARDSTPWPSPLYLAHMTTDTPIVASLAYLCALLYNPNNVAPEASPVTTELEHDVNDDLCRLVGYRSGIGWAHLCSGGHAANYEATWIARNLRSFPLAIAEHPASRDLIAGMSSRSLVNLPIHRILDLMDVLAGRGALADVHKLAEQIRRRGTRGGKLLLASNVHYAWDKCADLLAFGPDDVEELGVDRDCRLDLSALDRRVRDLVEHGQPIAAVVATLGSSGEGSVDDLSGIIRLREDCERRYGASFYLHVDAAFGGYHRALCLKEDGSMLPFDAVAASGFPIRLKPEVYQAFKALPLTDSVTVDPHKSGHVPYPAGGLALRDKRATAVIASRSMYFGHGDGPRLPFGPHTLEGARPGAAAAAVWASHRLIGLHIAGYGRLLAGCMATAQRLHRRFRVNERSCRLDRAPQLVSCYEPDLNILNFTAEPAEAWPASNQRDAVNRLLLRQLRADAAAAPMTSLWVSGNLRAEPGTPDKAEQVLRLCVMKELDPATLDYVSRVLCDRVRQILSAIAPTPG